MTAALSSLVGRWSSVLTQTQRDAWDLWADNTPQSGAFGAYNMTGQNAYIAMNSPRMQIASAVIDAAPSVYAGAALTPPVLTIADDSANTVVFSFTNTDVWATAVGGFLLAYVGRPQNPGVSFYKGPYRLTGFISGAVVPPTSPSPALGSPYPIAIGQRIFMQFRALQADGRISTTTRSAILAVA